MEGDSSWILGRTSVVRCIESIRRGGTIIVMDDVGRENEGDLVLAASFSTPENIAEMVRLTSGILCAPMEAERVKELKLCPASLVNSDPRHTAFMTSVDARDGSTGVSATSRSATFRVLGDKGSQASDLQTPGHVFPLRAREGGVFERQGHTEASVDLCKLAGIYPPVAVIGEIVSQINPAHMATFDELQEMGNNHNFEVTTVADIIAYRTEIQTPSQSS